MLEQITREHPAFEERLTRKTETKTGKADLGDLETIQGEENVKTKPKSPAVNILIVRN